MIDVDAKVTVKERLIQFNELPSLPIGWTVERLRFLFKESKLRNGSSPVGEMLSVSEYHGVVPKIYEDEDLKRTNDELANYRVVKPGQLAVNSMWLNHLGLGVSNYEGHVSPAYEVYDISDRLDKRFVHHLLRSNYYLKIYLRYLYGIRPNSFQIKSSDWASIPIIVPDLSTQRQIADFLDRETARIDLLIEKKEKLVELIESKKSSVLTHTINQTTNGSDNAIISQNYWNENLSSILRPLKYCCVLNPDVLPDNTDSDYEFDYIDIGSVSLSEGIFKKERMIFGEAPSRARKILRDSDVLVSTVRTYLKAIAIVYPSDIDQIASTGFAVLRANQMCLPHYLLRTVQTDIFINQVVSLSVGVSYPAITPSVLGDIKIPFPDIQIQRQIIEYLDQKIPVLDLTKNRIINSIDLLREFRSSLITAAVTGQINIADWTKAGRTDRKLDSIQAETSA